MALLLEDGSRLLLEDGSALLLEADDGDTPPEPLPAPGRGRPSPNAAFVREGPSIARFRIHR